MTLQQKNVFPKGSLIGGKYSVQFFLHAGATAETYRVKNVQGKIFLLKLFNYAKLNRYQFTNEGEIHEIKLLKKLRHPNLAEYKDSGDLIIDGQRFAYLVLDFISGETLAERLKRETVVDQYSAVRIVTGILNGLKQLHNLPVPVIHNAVCLQNVMLDLSGPVEITKLIGFGCSQALTASRNYTSREGINPYYLAGECFNNVYTPQSDLFAAGALLYHLLFGLPPWFIEIPKFKSDKITIEHLILEERNKPLKYLSLEDETGHEIDRKLFKIIKKALHANVDARFRTADEFLRALNGEIEDIDTRTVRLTEKHSATKETNPNKKGKGFGQIAGMDELKNTLYQDVIRALNERELYEEYGLTIPNGMLLYGPPGCGKTFFSEKFAEEVGFNFISIKPSDLASIYVHGQQEKIGQLFTEARENAPTIIFIDELDALMPSREQNLSHSYAESVNEFLAQMTNCSKDGVFLIGATNRPDKLDPAILRTGRIDKIIYLPPPDFKARVAMFKLHLERRPLDFGIDYEELAHLTEHYVSSDIEFLVNEAARNALVRKSKISQLTLTAVISQSKPSVALSEIKKYEAMKRKLERADDRDERPTIGFGAK